eukprot:CAMPEP_0119042082 /NCGR_PEP_ID=MMETSP1177-20130426/14337_1 /TAXON_ID=2985 /ORGANISM="Ochromonas sp, Strain CCMP1899" /LENGTH=200 /DNA_ID=CAMNT_0007008607 /DNA_START=118 /DNA_END=720 /DNA_ORIENTATION=-
MTISSIKVISQKFLPGVASLMKTEISFFEMEVKHSWGKELEDLEYKSFIGNEFDKMGIKHSWEEEREISRCIGSLGGGSGLLSGKGYPPYCQGQPVYNTFITQKCSGCGAVRERSKFSAFRNDLESWSNFWDSDIMNLLACPLQSSNIVYKENGGFHNSYIYLNFRHGNIDYELFYDDRSPLIRVDITVPIMESSANNGN